MLGRQRHGRRHLAPPEQLSGCNPRYRRLDSKCADSSHWILGLSTGYRPGDLTTVRPILMHRCYAIGSQHCNGMKSGGDMVEFNVVDSSLLHSEPKVVVIEGVIKGAFNQLTHFNSGSGSGFVSVVVSTGGTP